MIYSNWEGISDWFGQKWDAVKTTFSTKWEGIKTMVSAWPKSFTTMGKNIVQGLLDGIEAKWSALKAKIREMADMLPQWLKKRLGIQSPSRVFMGLGGNIGEGLAIGIDKQQANVLGKMDAIRSKLITPMRTAAIGVSGVAATTAAAAPVAGLSDFTAPPAHISTAGKSVVVTLSPTYHITLGGDVSPDLMEMIRQLLEEHDRDQRLELERYLND